MKIHEITLMLVSVVFVVKLCCHFTVGKFHCLDQNNNPVDWFAIYKLPKLEENANSEPANDITERDGLQFYYMDANRIEFNNLSSLAISSTHTPLALTFSQYYANKNDTENVFFVLYNDEHPENLTAENSADSSQVWHSWQEYGHTKGSALFDSETGFWLVHSVPKFPHPATYGYPESGDDFGQSILCISLEYDQLEQIGNQLYFNNPDIYASNLPPKMAPDFAKLKSVIDNRGHQSGKINTNIVQIFTTSVSQIPFLGFAKSADFDQDLYSKLIAPTVKAELFAETWRRGHHIPLNCSVPYPVLDAQYMRVANSEKFHYTKDHSKFAVSNRTEKPWVCFADINRMTSQYERGGGALCLQNSQVWKQYRRTIVSTNHCTDNSDKGGIIS